LTWIVLHLASEKNIVVSSAWMLMQHCAWVIELTSFGFCLFLFNVLFSNTLSI